MADPLDALPTAEEVRTLATRVTAALEALNGTTDDLDDEADLRLREQLEGFAMAIFYCAAAAEVVADPLLIPVLEALRVEAACWTAMPLHDVRPLECIEQAIAALLGSDALPRSVLLDLVEHETPSLRARVAERLDPARRVEREALRTLAADLDATVRRAARARLETVEPVAWWWGTFAQDPLRELSAIEVERCKPFLAKLMARIDAGDPLDPAHAVGFIAMVRRLPDALAIAVIEREARDAAKVNPKAHGGDLLFDLLRRDGGEAALLRLLESWADADYFEKNAALKQAVRAFARLPAARHVVVGRALMAAALVLHDRALSAPSDAGEIFAEGWRREVDATPLVDVFLTQARDPAGGLVAGHWKLTKRLSGFQLPLGVRKRLLRLWLREDSPLPSVVASALYGWIAPMPDRLLRPVAEKILAHDRREDRLQGALSWWFARFHEERDGSREEVTKRFFADPRLRAVILASPELIRHAFVSVRGALRAGELGLYEVCRALRVIDDCYGGLARNPGRLPRPHAVRVPRRSARGVDGKARLRIPAPLRGEITAHEWALFRRLRARHPAVTTAEWMTLIDTMPEGPLQSEDRGLVDAAIQRVRGGDGFLARSIAFVLSLTATVQDIGLFDALIEILSESPGGGSSVRFIRDQRQEAVARLGVFIPLPAPKGSVVATSSGPSAAWMDERDDG